MSGTRLIRDDPNWQFRDLAGQQVTRRLRAWTSGVGLPLIVMITERGPGTPTSAAPHAVAVAVADQLQRDFPATPFTLIEHHPAAGPVPEHFRTVGWDHRGMPRWLPLSAEAVYATLQLDHPPAVIDDTVTFRGWPREQLVIAERGSEPVGVLTAVSDDGSLAWGGGMPHAAMLRLADEILNIMGCSGEHLRAQLLDALSALPTDRAWTMSGTLIHGALLP